METRVVLVPDAWDDFHYRTTFDLWLFSPGGRRRGRIPKYIGKVKIACVGQQPGLSPLPQGEFNILNTPGGPRWFSLGDLKYYDELRTYVSDFARERILNVLGDIAHGQRSFDTAMGEPVTEKSLLRGVEVQTVVTQYRRVAKGGAPLTNYSFRYTSPPRAAGDAEARQTLTFEVDPASNPASNIHILIGRNGAGKTTLLRNIADAVTRPGLAPAVDGVIEHLDVAATSGARSSLTRYRSPSVHSTPSLLQTAMVFPRFPTNTWAWRPKMAPTGASPQTNWRKSSSSPLWRSRRRVGGGIGSRLLSSSVPTRISLVPASTTTHATPPTVG